ncbi:hypothetical protein ALC57_13014, partial [Trachymyrmex cornetzi]
VHLSRTDDARPTREENYGPCCVALVGLARAIIAICGNGSAVILVGALRRKEERKEGVRVDPLKNQHYAPRHADAHGARSGKSRRKPVRCIWRWRWCKKREKERESTLSLYRVRATMANTRSGMGTTGGRKCVSAAGGHRARDARFGHQIDIRIQ